MKIWSILEQNLLNFLWITEMGQSAQAFDEMVKSLEQREVERKQTEQTPLKSEECAKRLAQENAIMAEIGRIISSTLNIDEVYQHFAEEVHKLISFDGIAINIINHQEGTVTIPYVSGAAVPGRQPGVTFSLKGSVAEEVVRTNSGLIVHLEDKHELQARFPTLLPVFEEGFRSVMAVPLISKDQVIGTMHFRSAKPKAYSDRDLRLAENIAFQIAGAIANAQLYADLKRVEEALRERERFLTNIFDSIQDGITILDHDFNIIRVNSTVEKWHSHALPLIGKKCYKVYQNRNDRCEVCPSYQTIQTGTPAHAIITRKEGRDGKTIKWLDLLSFPLTDIETGKIKGVIEYVRDITDRKRIEEALKESEERFRQLYDEAPVGYHEVDSHGRITQVNRTELAMLGYTVEEMIGQPLWRFLVEEEKDRQTIMAKLSGSIKPGRAFERTYKRKDGTTLPVLIEDRLLRNGEGQIIGIRATIQDITERKKAEEEKAALQEQLRQSQKMEAIGRLAGGIAHDFNNLLTAIKGYSQLSLFELKEGDPLKGNIEEIQKASQKASDLTRQLLAFSRRQILEFKVLDLNTIVRDLDKMLHRMLGEDIELIYALDDHLGRVKGDPGQIEQVILNLAVNARDAMPSGGKLIIETANVELDDVYARSHIAVTPGRYVILSVTDTGVGMTPEVKERIFEPFFTTKEKGKGTGLGLSTAYGIVKQSGGNIWVYSEPGKGTTFKIYLPRVDELPEEMRKKEIGGEIPFGSETILVVEDEEVVRKLAVKILEKQGYKVLEASNGVDASAICERRKEPIHLILTDVVMPGMNGHQLVEQFRQVFQDFKVLYMSGYTDNTIVHHGVLKKGINYIQKPFTPDALARKVREVLDR
jgi:PAS domain S-box-containing protein